MIINASGDISKLSLEMQEFMKFICTGKATGTKDNFVHRLNNVVEDNRLHEKWRSEYMRFELKMQEQYRAGLEEGRKEEKLSTARTLRFGLAAAIAFAVNPKRVPNSTKVPRSGSQEINPAISSYCYMAYFSIFLFKYFLKSKDDFSYSE